MRQYHARDGPVKSNLKAPWSVIREGLFTVTLQSLLLLKGPLVKRGFRKKRVPIGLPYIVPEAYAEILDV